MDGYYIKTTKAQRRKRKIQKDLCAFVVFHKFMEKTIDFIFSIAYTATLLKTIFNFKGIKK